MTGISKKKSAESTDPHVREAYIAESREKYTAPPLPVSPTAIPMQIVAPIPVATPSPIVTPKLPKNELLAIKGIDEKIASQLEKLGINNIDDLAEASAEHLTKDLKVALSTIQKWIATAKKLQLTRG